MAHESRDFALCDDARPDPANAFRHDFRGADDYDARALPLLLVVTKGGRRRHRIRGKSGAPQSACYWHAIPPVAKGNKRAARLGRSQRCMGFAPSAASGASFLLPTGVQLPPAAALRRSHTRGQRPPPFPRDSRVSWHTVSLRAQSSEHPNTFTSFRRRTLQCSDVRLGGQETRKRVLELRCPVTVPREICSLGRMNDDRTDLEVLQQRRDRKLLATTSEMRGGPPSFPTAHRARRLSRVATE